MNQNEIIKKICEHKYIDLINSINADYPNFSIDFYLFKSKLNDTFYLGFGEKKEISEKELKNIKGPVVVSGTFEADCRYYSFDQYLFYKTGTLETKLNIDLNVGNEFFDDFKLKDIQYIQDQKNWDKMMTEALELIHQKQFSKIVLSRDISYLFDYLNPISFISKLLANNDNAKNSFLIINKCNDTYNISLSPELLFEMNNGLIRSMSLAGSTPITSNENTNVINEKLLLQDEKLTTEHAIVTSAIVNDFESLCEKYEVSATSILKLDYVQHRLQTIVGKLKTSFSIDQIIKTLHPTPAVGTMPKANGIKIINQIENKKRGFYAAPSGIISQNFAEVAVMLRSATITNNQIVLHTGCGITSGSISQNEWDETENKTRPYKRLFNQQ